MQEFGDNWTIAKIDVLVKYANAYLSIMKDRKYFKLIYFDGFAGAGHIDLNFERRVDGAATKILEINEPRGFDHYYFVELDSRKAKSLRDGIESRFPNKFSQCQVIEDDCNNRLISMAKFLGEVENKNYRVLAYIDPQGMQVKHASLLAYKDLDGVDAWILIPTGIGTNRLLKRNGDISENWISKISEHLGISEEEIKEIFYYKNPQTNLFGDSEILKENNAIEIAINLYKKKLTEIWKYASKPIALKNQTNSTMFHFIMVSNNKTAVKIANEIASKY